MREIIYIIPIIYHLFRYRYNYGQCNCQLESIENRVLKKFNLDLTESCLRFPGCRQIKTCVDIQQLRDKRLLRKVCQQPKDLKTELIKDLEQSMSHSLKYFQRVLKN